jgi:hypothetical protein
MNDQITPILMPKWGLSMRVGTLAVWHVDVGTEITPGDEIMDVETADDKERHKTERNEALYPLKGS